VALYALAAMSCWLTARKLSSAQERRIWWCIALLFLLLGINKQLDLQSALTELGRSIALEQGWYRQRQIVQTEFIVGVAAACAVATLVLLIWARRAPLPTWIGLAGVILVFGFVLVRAASFHHVDQLIKATILGVRWNWIIEIGGIGLVLLASLWRRRGNSLNNHRLMPGRTKE
jgi:hypothetical protein